MKKLEIYANSESCVDVAKVLDSLKLYWYKEEVSLHGENVLCKATVYVPISVVEEVVTAVTNVLDMRKIENLLIISDVESGVGAPYKIIERKFLIRIPSIIGRPSFMIIEEAEERARISIIHLALVAIASLVALIGLVLNNPYIIIGAMLLSPILGPIYSFSILLSWGRPKSALTALASLTSLISAALIPPFIAALAAAIIGHSLPVTDEAKARALVGWVSFALPVLLGMASVLATFSSIWEVLTGVAIAAALIPPTATLALGLAIGDPLLAGNAAANLALNVSGLLTGGITASIALKAWGYAKGRRYS